ncbi:MAG: hypothetical protein WBZ24_03050 [Anaerolineales bacterium]
MVRHTRVSGALAVLAFALGALGCQPRLEGQIDCPVTEPNGAAPAGESVSPLYLTQDGLTTVLWPDGRIPFDSEGPGEIRDDGSLAVKFPFWRADGIRGQLMISGRRLDDDSPPAFGEIPEGYGDTGFQASAIVFPTPGCWEVTARAGAAQMRFVQKVVVQAD